MDQDFFRQFLHRDAETHKYNYGHVLVIGGSPGMVGAPYLSARAALRSGAGLVTIASFRGVIDKLETRVEEIMTFAFVDDMTQSIECLQEFITNRKVNVIVLGPGLAQNDYSIQLVDWLILHCNVPLIIDGGALSIGKMLLLELPNNNKRDIILTPHFGEFKKLTEHTFDVEDITKVNAIARQFAQKHHVSIVLKSSKTLIVGPDGSAHKNTTGNPGLATAGTGDVLTGVIAAMLVQQKLDPYTAAKAGVYLHGLAGDLAAAIKSQPSLIASDVIEALPQAFQYHNTV
jgi:hydroxyethylthiazole kinase-like uncharacterized protein yjeF